jgi:hypothetical protein
MWNVISKVINTDDGPGRLLGLADTFGFLPPAASLLLKGLKRAPAPTAIELGGDWIKNLDTISHSIGCMAAGIFDELVDGMDKDEVNAVTEEQFAEAVGHLPMASVIVSTFDVCKQVYLQYGDLTDAIRDGKVKPEGMMTHAFVSPLIKKHQDQGESATTRKGKQSFLKNMISDKSKVVANRGRSKSFVTEV